MKKTLLILLTFGLFGETYAQNNSSQPDTAQYDNLMMMSLEELMNIEITTASKSLFEIESSNFCQHYISESEYDESGSRGSCFLVIL